MGLRYECRKQIATESNFSCSRISLTKFEVTSLSKSDTIFRQLQFAHLFRKYDVVGPPGLASGIVDHKSLCDHAVELTIGLLFLG